jgi:predicted HicB family RNase H-like nuclease
MNAEADGDDDSSGAAEGRSSRHGDRERVHLRLPKALVEALKTKAAEEEISFERLIRRTLEETVGHPKGRRGSD